MSGCLQTWIQSTLNIGILERLSFLGPFSLTLKAFSFLTSLPDTTPLSALNKNASYILYER